MISKLVVFFVVSKLVLLYFFSKFIQTSKRTPINLQEQYRQDGGVEKSILDLKTYVELIEENSTSIDSKRMKKHLYDDKFCFRLSWKYPLQVETNAGLSRYTIRDQSTVLSNHSEVCNRFVTMTKFQGLMGNQMFEIAAVIGVAYSYDIIPIIPQKLLLDEHFDLPNRYGRNFKGLENAVSCFCEFSSIFYDCKKALNSTANVTLHGWMQSWKYFNDAKHLIRKLFSLKSKHTINAKRFLANVTTYGYQHVCIHVRRGDFVRRINEGFTVADVSYINRAKLFYINKYTKVDFVLTTNDKKWCRENIKNVPISPFKSRGDDMALMALSDHVIVTSGTFGWWGAWLSGGTTVYFKGFPGYGRSKYFNRTDYYPSSWIGL